MLGRKRLDRLKDSPRAVALVALAGLLAYVAWMGGPYLRSIVVRDAAVTTWISIAHAPIDGFLGLRPLYAGERVGPDGRIVGIDNPLADATKLAQAQADLDRAVAQLVRLTEVVATLEGIVEDRTRLVSDYAATFKRDLQAEIEGATRTIAIISHRLELERAEAERMARLAKTGSGSQSAADAAMGRVTEHERALAETGTTLAQARLRLAGAEKGVFLLDDGSDGATAQRSLEQARLELERARTELAIARVHAAAMQDVADAASDLYAKTRAGTVSAPPGALVWSLVGGPGGAVRAGMPVATWIDCSIMLVDVPLSDVEVALLSQGAPADVVLEGEDRVRSGTVLFTRGSASTLGLDDLAAVAKGRHPGTGQAILQLQPEPADIEACPIGHAAYIDFPGVGLIDIILSRLRL
jgi:multidrug resistance efflux pump